MRALVVAVVVVAARTAMAQVFPLPDHGPPPTPPPLHPPQPQVFFSLSAGTGGGVIGGETEGVEADVETGPQWAPLHLRLELGAFRNPRWALALSGRLGLPLGVDIGDPPAAKSVLVRLYRFVGPLRFSAALGAGYVRYRVGVDGTSTDTMAAGPVLAGVSAGYVFPISTSWRVVVDVNALAAIAASKDYADVHSEHAVHFELDVGLAVYR